MEEKINVGIDVGTENTRVAIKGNNGYEVQENKELETPSTVGFTDDGEVIVGVKLDAGVQCDVVYGVKNIIGRKKGDPILEQKFKNVPFIINYDSNDSPLIHFAGKSDEHKPEEILAYILEEMNKVVIKKTNKGIGRCVIPVPAYFNNDQRDAIINAANIANIECVHIIDEPIAAVTAFQEKNQINDGYVLVFDFGSNALNITILNLKDNMFTIIATSVDTSICGEYIDALIFQKILDKFYQKSPEIDRELNQNALLLLKQKSKEVKLKLSKCISEDIIIDPFVNEGALKVNLKQSEIGFICDNISTKIEEQINEVLEDAELEKYDIDHIIMMGGSSNNRFVKETVSNCFEECENISINMIGSNDAIAIGAAIICDNISSEKTTGLDTAYEEPDVAIDEGCYVSCCQIY